MANRYSNRSERYDREQNQQGGQNFGGSRRDQNFNEYNRGQNFSGGYSTQSSNAGRGYNQDRGNYGRNQSSDFNRNIGSHFGGGSRGNFGSNRGFGRNSGDDREGRYDVGRDFLTNQPIRESYGEMDDSSRGYQSFGGQQNFGRRSSSDYGSDYGNEFRYSEPNRDFSERGGFSGSNYGSYGDRGFSSSFDRDDFDSGRTSFDESIAGRSYYGSGSNRNLERPGWRGYGSRTGSSGWMDRERPDDWNRQAYSGERYSYGSRSPRNFFNTDYASTQYGGYNRNTDDSWSFDRDRGDYTGSGFYRSDYDRGRYDYGDRGESFGDKVKNFFGIGPKGYKRSDDRIREDVSERLEDHPEVDASNIEIQVSDGEVTLTGSTPDRRSKRLAEDVAENIRGVNDVHNQIRVQASTGTGESFRTGSTSTTGSTSAASSGQTGSTTSTTKKGSERAA